MPLNPDERVKTLKSQWGVWGQWRESRLKSQESRLESRLKSQDSIKTQEWVLTADTLVSDTLPPDSCFIVWVPTFFNVSDTFQFIWLYLLWWALTIPKIWRRGTHESDSVLRSTIEPNTCYFHQKSIHVSDTFSSRRFSFCLWPLIRLVGVTTLDRSNPLS